MCRSRCGAIVFITLQAVLQTIVNLHVFISPLFSHYGFVALWFFGEGHTYDPACC
uniref:Uncharacterized protein n=1 Tax=Arundo donax TaxID=35708 RepID=A0A0A8Y779_ARUDO